MEESGMSKTFSFTLFLARLADTFTVVHLLCVELITACLRGDWRAFVWRSVEILPKGVLLFKSVQVSDSGVYTCRAVNALGSTSQNITLTVRGETIQSLFLLATDSHSTVSFLLLYVYYSACALLSGMRHDLLQSVLVGSQMRGRREATGFRL